MRGNAESSSGLMPGDLFRRVLDKVFIVGWTENLVNEMKTNHILMLINGSTYINKWKYKLNCMSALYHSLRDAITISQCFFNLLAPLG